MWVKERERETSYRGPADTEKTESAIKAWTLAACLQNGVLGKPNGTRRSPAYDTPNATRQADWTPSTAATSKKTISISQRIHKPSPQSKQHESL